ncbi:hypothetical protein [Burkholderia cenocepacia]|uniref:hypothetical protein n=1 Tax=Burkholderia cenocepacia TaxID=95486 RepID=UPI002651BD70|nr:hypothetical protein [Burkholderia cenocepacia]MDN7540222.1 hypothetical protein [Burkholderia cenocepacia]
MVTNHYLSHPPVIDPYTVIDDFGKVWRLVPDMDYFGDWSDEQAKAAVAFKRSGEGH